VKFSNISALSRTHRPKNGKGMRVRSHARLLWLVLPIVVVGLTAGSALASSSPGSAPAVTGGSPPANTAPPVVSGTAKDGQTLTSTTGTWTSQQTISYSFQWLRCNTSGASCVSIAAATSSTYRLTSADVGSTIRSRVTATDTSGSSSAQSAQTAAVLAAVPWWLALPVVSGTAKVGQVLSSSAGSWAGTTPMTYSYQWWRCNSSGGSCVSISGATGSSYVVGSGDLGSTLRSRVTASNTAGSASALSMQTAVVVSGSGSASSSIYWGALMDGSTYSYLYGGSWGNAPWDANTWNKFESNAGKKTSIEHWSESSPWAHDFTYFKSTYDLVQNRGDLNLVDMSSGSVPLRDIANGLYDSSLKTWAQQAAAWGHPFFLRFDSEMNGNWEPYSPGVNGNTAADFVNAWKRFHDLANQAGATNITWVWCPNRESGVTSPLEQLYPGDTYVDWTGIDGFNKNTSVWSSFSSVFSPTYNHLLQLAPTKPIMIAEVSSQETGGSKASWITDALSTQLPTYFPRVEAFVWFNWRIYQNSTWNSFEIESSASSQQAFHNGIASSYYAPGGSFGNLPLLTKIKPLP
jgi:hypothetical protein